MTSKEGLSSFSVVEVPPELMAESVRRGFDFARSEFVWESSSEHAVGQPPSHVLLRDDELVAIVHRCIKGGWIASDYGGEPINLQPVGEQDARSLALQSALLLFAPVRSDN